MAEGVHHGSVVERVDERSEGVAWVKTGRDSKLVDIKVVDESNLNIFTDNMRTYLIFMPSIFKPKSNEKRDKKGPFLPLCPL